MSATGNGAAGPISRRTRFEDLPEFLTPDEARTWLGIGRSLIYSLVRAGELEHVRFGRIVRIPKSAIAQSASRSSR